MQKWEYQFIEGDLWYVDAINFELLDRKQKRETRLYPYLNKLGDAAVDASLVPFHKKLAELEAQAEPPKEATYELPIRQRKLVTLVFVDVVGSTTMTQDLDPEDTMEVLDKPILRSAPPMLQRLSEQVVLTKVKSSL
jgi:hypothetical protein